MSTTTTAGYEGMQLSALLTLFWVCLKICLNGFMLGTGDRDFLCSSQVLRSYPQRPLFAPGPDSDDEAPDSERRLHRDEDLRASLGEGHLAMEATETI